jgi:hypothetical protein
MNTTQEIAALRTNIKNLRLAFDRAVAAADEIGDRVEAAGGGDSGEETQAARFLMTTFRAREARLLQVAADLNHARAALRLTETFAQRSLFEVAA